MRFACIALAGLLAVTALGQTQPSPISVTIVGAVVKPGVYQSRFGRPLTIRQLLAISGGLTKTANKKTVHIERVREAPQPGTANVLETIKVNLDSILIGKTTDITLESGDVIRVPEKPQPDAPGVLPPFPSDIALLSR